MIETYDVAVLGAGPSGMAAATEAARRGARVVLLDENVAPGGQAHRAAPPGFFVPRDPDRDAGDALRDALARSGAVVRTGHRVWGLGGGPLVPEGAPLAPFRIDLLSDAGPVTLEARALLLCTGTQERIIPFPGWTLPGVIGLGAAMMLMKAQGVLPGRRVLVAGAGPLLYAATTRLMAAGAEVVAVADLASRAEWARALPALAARPDLLLRGAAWRAKLAGSGVPHFVAHRVVAAEGGAVLERVRIAPDGDGAVEAFDCDVLCIGHGLTPATEATRLFRAQHRHDRVGGGWVPVLDADRRSSVPLLYVAGDAGGLRGAAAAPASGRLAALAALRDLEILDGRAHARARWRPWLDHWRASRSGAAMARLMALRPALVAAIPPETVVCRCAGVTRAEIEAALDDGAAEMDQLGQFTACGTGACQGRLCGEAVAELVALRVGGREHAGFAKAHLPLRPVPMEAVLDDVGRRDVPAAATFGAAPI